MTGGLPRAVVAILSCVVPARHRREVLADLADDYRRARAARTRWSAAWWLWCESLSLGRAYAWAALLSPLAQVPALRRDIRWVMRSLRRAAGTTLGAAATLAAGLLAVLVTTGLTRPLLLRPVSAVHGPALRRVVSADRNGRIGVGMSHVELEAVRRHLEGAATVTAVNLQPVLLRSGGTDSHSVVEVVDGNYFAVAGSPMVLGRALVASDDRPGAPPVVVMGEALWRRRFGADPAVLGQTVELNRVGFSVVGVTAASASASAFGGAVDLWAPVAQADPLLGAGWRTDVSARWFSMFALPRRSVAEVDARLAAAATSLARQLPATWNERTLRTAAGTVLTGQQRRDAITLVWILAALSSLILAAGAANVAGLLLARAAAGEQQAAIHRSMGASGWAIVRRVLIEGATLGLAGGALALGGYLWTRRVLAELTLLPTLALRVDLPLDATLVALVALGSVVTGAGLALGPALWAARTAAMTTLGAGATRALGGRSLSRMRRVLVSAQIGVCLALVVGAALLGRSLHALEAGDVGFPRGGLVAMDFDIEPIGPPGQSALTARAALDLAATAPGITAAAMSNRAPIDGSTPLVEVRRERGAAPIDEATMYLATSRYFDTVDVPLLRGRPFTVEECDGAADVVVVNESAARRLWADGDALGRSLILGADQREVRVVGVARDSKYRTLAESGQLHVYRPTPPAFHLTLLARAVGDPRQALGTIQQAIDRAGPGVVGFFPRTLADHLEIELLPTRAAARAAALLGGVSILLTIVGLYGLVSWFVERRRREIGVRLAIGARPADIVRLVVRQTLAAAAPGLLAGVVLAVLLGAAVRRVLYGVGPLDPTAFVTGALAMAAVVVVAAATPSWRAARVSATEALRDS
ncbi:MAG: ABC transporter permease [Vicinamibacterales bacterium]